MSLAKEMSDFASEVSDELNRVNHNIGSRDLLKTLRTRNKNLVGAINELKDEITASHEKHIREDIAYDFVKTFYDELNSEEEETPPPSMHCHC